MFFILLFNLCITVSGQNPDHFLRDLTKEEINSIIKNRFEYIPDSIANYKVKLAKYSHEEIQVMFTKALNTSYAFYGIDTSSIRTIDNVKYHVQKWSNRSYESLNSSSFQRKYSKRFKKFLDIASSEEEILSARFEIRVEILIDKDELNNPG
ncbi:MAG: hypothetical protein RIB63_02300, partial [Fulvivirga sp.]